MAWTPHSGIVLLYKHPVDKVIMVHIVHDIRSLGYSMQGNLTTFLMLVSRLEDVVRRTRPL